LKRNGYALDEGRANNEITNNRSFSSAEGGHVNTFERYQQIDNSRKAVSLLGYMIKKRPVGFVIGIPFISQVNHKDICIDQN
jgi:hypothetical protein